MWKILLRVLLQHNMIIAEKSMVCSAAYKKFKLR